MKKFLILLLIPIIIVTTNIDNEKLIRIRIVANSNTEYDQKLKMKVSEDIKEKLYNLLKNETNIENARKMIKSNINNISNILDEDLKNEEYTYSLNYGINHFPKKEYKGKIYKEGDYESLLITLGEGKGDNWWCILFPPICLVEAEESDNTQYTFFFKNIIDKIFG